MSALIDLMIDPNDLQTDLATAVANSNVAVSLSRSNWNGKLRDPAFREYMHHALGADVGAITGGDINLFFDPSTKNKSKTHSELRDVRYVLHSADAYYRENTMKASRNTRYLKTSKVEEFSRSMEEFKDKLAEAKERWRVVYDHTVDVSYHALMNLKGASITRDMYPSFDQIDNLFTLSYSIEPIASGKDFNGLPSHVAESLTQQLHKRVESNLRQSLDELWDETRSYVERLVTQMKKPEKRKIYESHFGDIAKTVEVLRGFNITGSQEVEALLRQLDDLADFDPDDARSYQSVRDEVARTGDATLTRLDELVGAGPSVGAVEHALSDARVSAGDELSPEDMLDQLDDVFS